MVYRRGTRRNLEFQSRTRTGWRQRSTGTSDRRLALRIEAMWEELAMDHRAWDVLDRVRRGGLTPAQLHDHWVAAKRQLATLRERLDDVDLVALVPGFLAVHQHQVTPETLAHITTHLRSLLPEGTRLARSEATADYLTKRLAGYPGKRNTLRKVHSAWSGFFHYLTAVKGLYAINPMQQVQRPRLQYMPIRFYELDVVERIVAWQPTPARRALMALAYGSAAEISVMLGLTRADFNPHRKEVRTAGTKAHTRDRISRVADWAWPIVWDYAKTVLPGALLWPGWSRWTASDWHAETVGDAPGLALRERLRMYNARHHWAVRALRAGTPLQLVQLQLGHASSQLTLMTYGRFMPTGADRDKWEAEATAYETERRNAK